MPDNKLSKPELISLLRKLRKENLKLKKAMELDNKLTRAEVIRLENEIQKLDPDRFDYAKGC